MPTVTIDGTDYEIPTLDSMTLDEAILFERIAGVGLETILPGSTIGVGVMKAFMVLSVLRARPETTEREASEHIGKMKMDELMKAWGAEDEDDARPPAPAEPSSAEPSGSSGNDGNGASASSPEEQPEPTTSGQPDSDTGFRSFHATSAG